MSTASYAAIPHLAQLAAGHVPAGSSSPFTWWLQSSRPPTAPRVPGTVRDRYAAEIAALGDIAERNFAYADNDVEFVYGLQSLMSLENAPIWQRELEGIANGEFEVACPWCGEHLYLVLHDEAFVATPNPDNGRQPNTALRPADPASLAGYERRILDLAVASGRLEVATMFLYAAGDATCPICGRLIKVPAALGADH